MNWILSDDACHIFDIKHFTYVYHLHEIVLIFISQNIHSIKSSDVRRSAMKRQWKVVQMVRSANSV